MSGSGFQLENVLLVLVDFADGPLSAVGSLSHDELRKAAGSLARAARLLELPVLELHAQLPPPAADWFASVRDALPSAPRVDHSTNNGWLTPDFVKAVESSGRRQLAFAGIATDVGVGLTAMSAVRAGYECVVLADACGTVSVRAEQAALIRLAQAGVTLNSWSGFVGEIQGDYTKGRGPELLKIVAGPMLPESPQPRMSAHGDRTTRGLEILRRIAAERSSQPLSDWNGIAPAMSQWIVDFIAGDVLSRPGLDLKSRQLATVAMLATLGDAPDEFRMHLKGAQRVGWTQPELVELLLQSAPFAGFPKALNALKLAKEVFASE